jgi:probable rRNA maturation factor
MGREAARVLVDVGDFEDAPADLLEDAARRALHTDPDGPSEVSIALLGDEGIRDLNARYLGEDRPTDVIAFTLGEGAEAVGDVYLGVEQAHRQAAELGVPIREELVRLVIHGVLHVLGHDHPEGSERQDSDMFALQERILRALIDERGVL